MKRILAFSVVVGFLLGAFTTPVSARHINIFATGGGCGSDFKGPVLSFGMEFQIFGKLYTQIVFDYYPDPMKENDLADFSANSLGLYLSQKFAVSRRVDFFVRGGAHYSTLKISAQVMTPQQVIDEVTAEESDGGVQFGGGFEYLLSRKFGILFGADYNLMFSRDKNKWFKVYGGLSFAIQ